MMKKVNRRAPGFSLMELMIYIAIIGILATFLVPKVGRLYYNLNKFRTNSVLKNWQSKINEYYLDINDYPSSLRDLAQRPAGKAGELWKRSYVETDEDPIPTDAFGNDIVYNRPPTVFRDKYKKYELISYGEENDAENPAKEGFLHAGA
jgi:general secretion pathway protein G